MYKDTTVTKTFYKFCYYRFLCFLFYHIYLSVEQLLPFSSKNTEKFNSLEYKILTEICMNLNH